VNAGAARGSGAEAGGDYSVSRSFNVFGNISYLDAIFTSYPNAQISYVTTAPTPGCPVPAGCIAQTNTNLAGTTLPRAPRFDGSIGGDLHAPVSNTFTGHLNLIGHYTTRYDFYPDAGGSQGYAYQPGYFIANVSGYLEHTVGNSSSGFGLKDYRIGFYINNATDKKYYWVRTPQASLGLLDTVAPPLTFGLRVSAGF